MTDSIDICQDLSNGKIRQAVEPHLSVWQDRVMKDGTPLTFGARLTLAMQRHNWRAKTLAEKAGVSEGGVSRHLKAVAPPKPDTLEKYRAALGVTTEWLGFGRGEMLPVSSGVAQGPSKIGMIALEEVLEDFQWPDIDISLMDAVVAAARAEAVSRDGAQRPASVWRVRLRQLARDLEKRRKK